MNPRDQPTRPTEAHRKLAKEVVGAYEFAVDGYAAQLIADSEARAKESLLVAYDTAVTTRSRIETALTAEREKVRVLREALSRRHDEQSYHCQYVDDALAATEAKP
jgi:hypothetical protein